MAEKIIMRTVCAVLLAFKAYENSFAGEWSAARVVNIIGKLLHALNAICFTLALVDVITNNLNFFQSLIDGSVVGVYWRRNFEQVSQQELIARYALNWTLQWY